MNDWSTWVLAASAIMGPAVAVYAANQMAKHENKRLEAAKLFRLLITNCTDYSTAALNAHKSKRQNREFKDSVAREFLGEEIKAERFRLRNLNSALIADVLSITLLFEKEGTECVNAVTELGSVVSMVETDEITSTDDFQAELKKRMDRVTMSIIELHKSLRRSDAFSHDA